MILQKLGVGASKKIELFKIDLKEINVKTFLLDFIFL